ncbi:MAG TPA: right-handed parallel beta-helix repeat-containing protein [Longimicrobiaceae bacterium]|jgi:hypothetical protein
MKAPLRKFLIREGNGVREADTLVLGTGMLVGETAGGLPELLGVAGGEILLQPSGGDDTQAISEALATGRDVRLAPGTFTISSTVTLGSAGTGQRLIGSGAAQTVVQASAPMAAVVAIAFRDCAVERLRVRGGEAGIRAVGSGAVTLRDLHIHNSERGIHLENVSGAEVSRVFIVFSPVGIYARSISRSTLRDVTVTQTWTGIQIENGTGVSCESIYTTGEDDMSPSGIAISGGTDYRLSQVQVENCQSPIALVGATRASLELLSLGFCNTGVLLDGTRDVTLSASRVWVSRNALVVRGCEDVVVGAFRSDNSLVTSPAPHVLVESSAGVFFTGIRIVKPSSSAYDVDVSLAGSRVLFGPHNIIPARINSGGNFAAL